MMEDMQQSTPPPQKRKQAASRSKQGQGEQAMDDPQTNLADDDPDFNLNVDRDYIASAKKQQR